MPISHLCALPVLNALQPIGLQDVGPGAQIVVAESPNVNVDLGSIDRAVSHATVLVFYHEHILHFDPSKGTATDAVSPSGTTLAAIRRSLGMSDGSRAAAGPILPSAQPYT